MNRLVNNLFVKEEDEIILGREDILKIIEFAVENKFLSIPHGLELKKDINEDDELILKLKGDSHE